MEKIVIFNIQHSCEDKKINPHYNEESIEISAVKINKGIIEEFHRFIKPEYIDNLTEFCKDLTGIDYNNLKSSNSLEIVLKEFYEFSKECSVISSIDLDKKFLTKEIMEKRTETLIFISKFIHANHINIKSHFNKITEKNFETIEEMSLFLGLPIDKNKSKAHLLSKIFLALEEKREISFKKMFSKEDMNQISSVLREIHNEIPSVDSYSSFFDLYSDLIFIDHETLNIQYLSQNKLDFILKMSM